MAEKKSSREPKLWPWYIRYTPSLIMGILGLVKMIEKGGNPDLTSLALLGVACFSFAWLQMIERKINLLQKIRGKARNVISKRKR